MRDRYNAFIRRHDIAWELAMAFLAIVYVAIGFALDDPAVAVDPAFAVIEPVLTTVFALEFITRFGASYDRARYLRGHWIDLVALLPATRGFRLARLLRLLRLIRAFAGIHRAVGQMERLAQHRGLATLIVAWAGVTVICCMALYAVERDVNPAIASPFDALWWGVATLSTVGYGDVYPLTPEGRLAATALMILGIGLFTAITAVATSFLISQRDDAPDAATDPIALIERLATLSRDGAITTEEFEAKRTQLLARI